MGTVYAGIQPLIGKKVAIKVLKTELSEDPEVMERFLAEAKAVNTIGHPNIIDIFAFGNFSDGSQYFVMEYLEGRALTDYFAENRPVGYAEAAKIFSQVFEALEAAHEHGIVHRDLKPDNIFLVERSSGAMTAKILDFGIAKLTEGGVLSGKTRTGVPIGTPLYMSPEQCQGVDVDLSSDIYSMGIILYQAFTGTVPFVSDSFFALLNAQVSSIPKRPAELSHVPSDLDRIIMWCLEKPKENRPESVRQLRETLIPVLERLAESESADAPQIVEQEPPSLDALASLPGNVGLSHPGGTVPPPEKKRSGLLVGGLVSVALLAVAAVVVGLFVYPKLTASEKEPKKDPGVSKKEVTPPPMKPEAPKKVTIQFMVNPPKAKYKIVVDGKELSKPEITVPKDKERPLKVKVTAEGYLDYNANPKPISDMVLPVQLTKKPDDTAESVGRRRRRRRRRRRASRESSTRQRDARTRTRTRQRRVKTANGF